MPRLNWTRSTVLVTGGTGSFGRHFIEAVVKARRPKRVIVFSRDEHKQYDMRHSGRFPSTVSYVVGDVRDEASLRHAMSGVDVVIHAAALKQVPLCEEQPSEAIRTNVFGAQNVIDAARHANVRRVLALSTDKAVHPVNAYGATKLLAERLFIAANPPGATSGPRFACVRYGNVIGSRSSFVPSLLEQRAKGLVRITHPDMTRFWLSLDQAVAFVIRCVDAMTGGEVFIPRARAASLAELISAIAPECKIVATGLRPGEKFHEILVSRDEAPFTREYDDHFVLRPWKASGSGRKFRGGSYRSDEAPRLTQEEIRRVVGTELGSPLAGGQRRARRTSR